MTDPPGAAEVAYALDGHGRVRTALTAPRADVYRCLACGGPLRPRRGRSAAFHHDPGARCHGRGVALRAARRILRDRLEEELRERGAVAWHRRCPGATGVCPDRVVFERWQRVEGWDEVAVIETEARRWSEGGDGATSRATGNETEAAEEASGTDRAVRGARERLDVVVMRGGKIALSIALRGPDMGAAANSPSPSAPETATVTLALAEVLAFGPRVLLGDEMSERCPACRARAEGGSGDGEFGWNAGRPVERVWRGVMEAAGGPKCT